MSVQIRNDWNNFASPIRGNMLSKDNETFLQDAGRSGNLVAGTVCSKNSAGKWVPFTDETATDGTEIPCGIIVHTLTEAELQAGDVTGVVVWVRIEEFDTANLTIENSKTLATIITSTGLSVENELQRQGIFVGTKRIGVNLENT
jgi:hypothetical protein